MALTVDLCPVYKAVAELAESVMKLFRGRSQTDYSLTCVRTHLSIE